MKNLESWGRFPKLNDQKVVGIASPKAELPLPPDGRTVLPYGLGRSYGDSCINNDNAVIDTSGLSCFISFDPERGIVRAEAGVSLATISACSCRAAGSCP